MARVLPRSAVHLPAPAVRLAGRAVPRGRPRWSESARAVVLVAALLLPLGWVFAAVSAGPTDGTLIQPPSATLSTTARWGPNGVAVQAADDKLGDLHSG